MNLSKILVPLDGSTLSQAALPWAQLLAGPQTEIHLLRAFREPREFLYTSLGPTPNDEEQTEQLIEKMREYLETQAGTLSGSVKMHAGCGEAAETILYQARRREVDLIVMASHGRGGMDRWLLGSVATKVLRGSRLPVLVVRPGKSAQVPSISRIMVPLDGSETGEKALRKAAEIARSHDAELLLYMGLSFPRTGFPSAMQQYIENGLSEGRKYLEKVARRVDSPVVGMEVRDTTPGHGIVEAAVDLGCDFMVMGSHGRSGVSRWMLGSVTESVVQESSLPVLVVYSDE